MYSDGWVDDARLVVSIAVDARERGATVLTRAKCASLRTADGRWSATIEHLDGRTEVVSARAVVNAAGPWVAEFLDAHTPTPARHHPRMIQGSHIVLRKLTDHPYAYIFQAPDGRFVFAIPFEQDYTLVGTTERDFTGDLACPAIDATEVQYLVDMVNRYFTRDLTPADVVWTFAGLRPLLASSTQDPKSITRDYVLDFDRRGPPLLSVYGGKLTTYRKLAEDVVDSSARRLARRLAMDAHGRCPAATCPDADFERVVAQISRATAGFPIRCCNVMHAHTAHA